MSYVSHASSFIPKAGHEYGQVRCVSNIYLNLCVYQWGQIIKVKHNNVHNLVVVKGGGGSTLFQMLEVLATFFICSFSGLVWR